MKITRCDATPVPRELDEHDVVLAVLELPITVHVLGAQAKAYEMLAASRGLQPPVLLFDGTNRVVARRINAPERSA